MILHYLHMRVMGQVSLKPDPESSSIRIVLQIKKTVRHQLTKRHVCELTNKTFNLSRGSKREEGEREIMIIIISIESNTDRVS